MLRRDLNRMALVWALSAWAGVRPALAGGRRLPGPAWQTNPFALGVASGQPRADSVVLWTRLLFSDADAAWQAQPASFAAAGMTAPVSEAARPANMKDLEREHILSTLREMGGSRKKTVEKLGISERTLRYKLQQYRDEGYEV